MFKTNSFVKKTRTGKVFKVVKEVYLRDDVPCGLESCSICSKFSSENPSYLQEIAQEYLIIDTNVALHQIDVLEHPSLRNVILLNTVMQEVQHKSKHLYSRLQQILNNNEKHFFVFSNEFHKETYVERLAQESPNDRNDKAIRVATSWYMKHFKPKQKSVILLTNDKDNLTKARLEGLNCQTIHDYVNDFVKRFSLPENLNMADMLVDPSALNESLTQEDKLEYTEYKSKSDIEAGIKNGIFYQGPLRMNRDNCMEGRVPCEALNDDILIQGLENLNRSINGDIVVVELLPKEKWTKPSNKIILDDIKDADELGPTEAITLMPSGKVVGIVKQNWKPYPGTIIKPSTSSPFVLFQPLDGAIPKIRLKTRQIENLLGKRIVVCIDQWDIHSRYPSGHYVRTIGVLGDVEVETEALLVQHDIPYQPFSQNIFSELPSPQWAADEDPDSKNPKRIDLRHLIVFSVDPPGCTDIDDALHVRKLPNGNYEIGVHIADVSHFVKEGTALDQEASRRGTTVYLVNKRIDMLPKILGENLCSIMGNIDRFAFSSIWEMNENAEIIETKFTKSIIRSRAAMTYEQAQLRIDDNRQNDEITISLRNLNMLAKKLKQKRIANGALTLASPAVKFIKDEETQNPVDIELYQLRETNSMVEEFMLLANISVAQKIYESFPSYALLRRHPHPNKRAFTSLNQSLKKFNISLNISSSKELSDSLDKATTKDEYFNTLVRILTTRCMNQAVYFSSGSAGIDQFQHYGLATSIYTHFTSPIRRYADILVHRLLASAITVSPLPELDNHKVQKLSDEINKRHHMAQYASRSSIALHTLIFFKNKKEKQMGYVTRVKRNGFTVIIPKYGFEGIVYLNDNPGEDTGFAFDENTQTLTSIKNHQLQLSVFSQVPIQIQVDEEKQKLKLDLIREEIQNNESISSIPQGIKRTLEEEEHINSNNTTNTNAHKNETNLKPKQKKLKKK